MIGNLPPWSGHIKSGKVHALAVTAQKRHSGLPDVPTLAATLPGFETAAWFGVLAPVGTPKIIVVRMNKEVNEVLLQVDVRERLANLGCDPAGTTPELFASRINGEMVRWKKLAAEKISGQTEAWLASHQSFNTKRHFLARVCIKFFLVQLDSERSGLGYRKTAIDQHRMSV